MRSENERPSECVCGCTYSGISFPRRYISRAEKAAELERYLTQLEAECAGVRQQIAELKQAPAGGGKQPCSG